MTPPDTPFLNVLASGVVAELSSNKQRQKLPRRYSESMPLLPKPSSALKLRHRGGPKSIAPTTSTTMMPLETIDAATDAQTTDNHAEPDKLQRKSADGIRGSSKRIQQYLHQMAPALLLPEPVPSPTITTTTTTNGLKVLVGMPVWVCLSEMEFAYWPGRATYDPASGKLQKIDRKNCRSVHVRLALHAKVQHRWSLESDVLMWSEMDVNFAREQLIKKVRDAHVHLPLFEEAVKSMQEIPTPARKPSAPRSRKPEPEDDDTDDDDVETAASSMSVEGDEMGPPCWICEKLNSPVTCNGRCGRSFHLACLGLNSMPREQFICDRCSMSVRECMHCNMYATPMAESTQVFQCLQKNCGQYFHTDCALAYEASEPRNTGDFLCPLHRCSRCKEAVSLSKSGVARCLKCPTAYHYKCMPAGSTILNDSHIVCSRHAERRVIKNYDYCVFCNDLGELLCCDGCPSAAHQKCLGLSDIPERWICMECHTRRLPSFGDIATIRYGAWRMWPVILLDWEHRPDWLEKRKHKKSDVGVRFLGTQYQWVSLSLLMPYDESLLPPPKTYPSTAVDKQYKAACEEAKQLHQNELTASTNKDPTVPKYHKLSKSVYMPPCKPIKQVFENGEDECMCAPNDNCGANCLNRCIYIECDATRCQRPDCSNRRLGNKEWQPLELFFAGNKGWGVKCKAPVRRGDLIAEYTGEVINEMQCAERLKNSKEQGIRHFYFITLDDDRIIDASFKGSISRFINHSCSPNCETQKWTVNGVSRIGIYAIDDLEAGAELSFDYQFDSLLQQSQPCLCGAPNCSGFIGQKKKKNGKGAEPEAVKAPSKPKRKRPSAAERRQKLADAASGLPASYQITAADLDFYIKDTAKPKPKRKRPSAAEIRQKLADAAMAATADGTAPEAASAEEPGSSESLPVAKKPRVYHRKPLVSAAPSPAPITTKRSSSSANTGSVSLASAKKPRMRRSLEASPPVSAIPTEGTAAATRSLYGARKRKMSISSIVDGVPTSNKRSQPYIAVPITPPPLPAHLLLNRTVPTVPTATTITMTTTPAHAREH